MAEQGVGAAVGSPDHALDEAATEAGEQYAAAVHCGAMPSGVLDLRRVPAGRTVGKLVPRTDLRSSLERYAAKVLAIVRHNRTQDPTHPASVMTLPRLLAQCAYHFRAKEWRELGVSLDVVPSVAAYAALCKQVDNTVHAVFASRDILTLHELQREVPLLLGGASGGGDWEALGTLHSVSQNPCAIVYFGARLPASLSVPDVTSSDVLAYMYAAGTGTRPGAKGAPAAPEATVRATLAGFAASVAAEKGWSAERAAACVAHPEMLGVWMRRIAAVLEAVDTERTRIRSAAADGLRVAEAAAAAAPDGAAPPLRIGTRSDATLPEEVRLAAWVVRIVKAANESQTATQAAVAPTFHASPRLSGSLIRKVFLQPWTVAPADQALVTSSLRGLLHPAVDPAYGERETAEAKGSDGSESGSDSDSSTGSSDTTETRSSDSSSAAEVRRKSLASRLEKRVDLKEKKLRRRFERRQEQRSCAETERVMADHRRRQTEREAYVSLGIATRPDVVATLRAALRSVPQAEWHAAETLAALEKAVVAAHTAPLHAVEAKVGPLPSLLLEAVQGLATGAGEGATRGKAKKTGGAEADSDGDDDGDSDSDEEEDNGQVAPRRQRVAAVLSVLREVVEECRDEGLLAGADLAEVFQGEVVAVGGGDDEDEEGCDDDDAAVAAEDDATTQAFFLRFLGYVETRVLSLLSRDAGKPCESFAALRLGCFTAFVAAAPGASCGDDEDDDDDEGVDDEDENAAAAAAPLAVLTPLFDSLLLKYLTGDAAGGCVRRRYADAKVAALLEQRGGDGGGGGDARRHRARTALRLPAEVDAALRGFLAGVLDKLVGGAALAGEAEEGDDAEGDVAAAAATGRDAVGAREMWLAWDLTCRAFPAFFHEGHGESVELFRRVLGEVADDAAAAAAGGDAAAPVAPLAPAAALLPLAPRCAASVCASGHARGLCYMPEGGTPALLPRRRFAAAEADELLSVRPSPPLVSRAVLGAGAGEAAATLAALRRRVAAYLQSPEMPRLAEVKAHLSWDAALAPALGEVTAFLRAANIAHVTAGSYGTVACAAAAGEDAAAAGACRRLVTPSEVYVVAPASSAHASVDRVKELVEAGEGVEVAYCLLSHVAARTASTHGGSGASDLTLVCEAVRASFLAVEGEGMRCATVMHAALALPRDAGFYLTSAVLLPALVRSTPSAVSRLLNLAATRLRLPQRLALFNIVAASAAASAGQLLRAKLVEREQAPGQPQQQQQQQQVVEAAATSATSAAAEPAQPSKPAAPSQAAAPAKKKAAAKPAALVPAAAAASPRAYVEELLQQEFGEGVELDAVGRQLLETNLSRLGRAIVRLASDLYSSDVHFVLELIQNADDNTYPATRAGAEVVPTLRLDVTGDAVVVSNNEVGFRPENIRALCDVGSSTKMGAEGYIGMKGIGFKSVFRVTASPEIHSSGFHIAFNVAAEAEGGKGSMGYISPTWLGDDGEQGHPDRSVVARKSGDDGGADGGYATQIVLPLLPDLRGSEGRSELIEKMEDVQPSLLLFLRKVRNLVVRDHVRGTVLDMVRRDLGRIAPSAEQAAAASTASSSSSSHADIVEVSVNKQPFKWLVKRGGYSTRGEVVRQDLRGDVATTELALAFPLDAPSSGGGDEREDMMVFAFLPLRTCGLKFVLQGDWAIPTSREDIDAGSPWNQWLRAKIPGLFVSALDNFKACHAPEAQPAALSTFLTFVPEGAGVIPFFRPLVQGVRALLLGTPCMLTSAGGWALPSDVVVLPDTLAAPPCSLASVLAPEATLRAALDKVYLHPGVELSEKMARHLRVGRIGVAELVTLLEHKLGARDEDDDDGVSYRAWLRCWIHSVTACLDGRCGTPSSAAATPALFERLKRLRFVPLEGGGVGSVRDGAIFSAASAAAGAGAAGKTRAAEKEEEEAAPSPASASVLDPQDARYRPLTKGMRMLDAGMLEGAEPAVAAFFVSLGVRRLTPLDVVERFLLPRYRELSAAREGGGGLVAVAAAGAAGEGQVWEGAHGAAGTRVSVTAAFLHATVWFLAAHRGVLPDDARRKIAKVVLLHTNAGPVSPRETAVLFSSAYQAERRAGAAGAADGDSDSSSDDGAQHMEVDEDEPRTAYGPDRFHLRYTFSRAEGGTVSLRDRAKESGALSEKTTSEASARNPAGFVVVSDGYLGASAAVAAAAAAAGEEGEARKRRRGESAWELADALVSLGVEWFYAPTVKRVWVSDYTKTSLWRDCAWPLASRSGEVLDRQCAPLEAALTKLVACFDQLGKKEKEKGEAKVRRGESFARMGEILSCLLCVAEEVNNAPHAAAAAQSDFVSSSDKKKKKQGGAAGLFATLGGNSAAAAGAKLPSSYTHMLRTLRWLPSSRYTLNTPPELLQRTPAATRLLGSAALHPLLPVLSDRRVAEAAALRTEVSAGDVVEALERQGTAAVSAGAAYGRSGYPASLSTMAAMYSFLREQHAAGSIAPECLATLRGGPVLFVPRTAARVNEVTGDTLGMFCRPSEVAWEDPVAELARPAAAGGGAKLYSVDADKGLLGELEGVLASDRDGAAGGGGAAAAAAAACAAPVQMPCLAPHYAGRVASGESSAKGEKEAVRLFFSEVFGVRPRPGFADQVGFLRGLAARAGGSVGGVLTGGGGVGDEQSAEAKSPLRALHAVVYTAADVSGYAAACAAHWGEVLLRGAEAAGDFFPPASVGGTAAAARELRQMALFAAEGRSGVVAAAGGASLCVNDLPAALRETVSERLSADGGKAAAAAAAAGVSVLATPPGRASRRCALAGLTRLFGLRRLSEHTDTSVLPATISWDASHELFNLLRAALPYCQRYFIAATTGSSSAAAADAAAADPAVTVGEALEAAGIRVAKRLDVQIKVGGGGGGGGSSDRRGGVACESAGAPTLFAQQTLFVRAARVRDYSEMLTELFRGVGLEEAVAAATTALTFEDVIDFSTRVMLQAQLGMSGGGDDGAQELERYMQAKGVPHLPAETRAWTLANAPLRPVVGGEGGSSGGAGTAAAANTLFPATALNPNLCASTGKTAETDDAEADGRLGQSAAQALETQVVEAIRKEDDEEGVDTDAAASAEKAAAAAGLKRRGANNEGAAEAKRRRKEDDSDLLTPQERRERLEATMEQAAERVGGGGGGGGSGGVGGVRSQDLPAERRPHFAILRSWLHEGAAQACTLRREDVKEKLGIVFQSGTLMVKAHTPGTIAERQAEELPLGFHVLACNGVPVLSTAELKLQLPKSATVELILSPDTFPENAASHVLPPRAQHARGGGGGPAAAAPRDSAGVGGADDARTPVFDASGNRIGFVGRDGVFAASIEPAGGAAALLPPPLPPGPRPTHPSRDASAGGAAQRPQTHHERAARAPRSTFCYSCGASDHTSGECPQLSEAERSRLAAVARNPKELPLYGRRGDDDGAGAGAGGGGGTEAAAPQGGDAGVGDATEQAAAPPLGTKRKRDFGEYNLDFDGSSQHPHAVEDEYVPTDYGGCDEYGRRLQQIFEDEVGKGKGGKGGKGPSGDSFEHAFAGKGKGSFEGGGKGKGGKGKGKGKGGDSGAVFGGGGGGGGGGKGKGKGGKSGKGFFEDRDAHGGKGGAKGPEGGGGGGGGKGGNELVEATAEQAKGALKGGRTEEEDDGFAKIGRWGEEFAYTHLSRRAGPMREYSWVNGGEETGASFDIIEWVTDASTGTVTEKYLEVKATVSDSKMYFEMSYRELQFAQAKGDHYSIVRVFSAGTPNARFIIINNPLAEVRRGNIRIRGTLVLTLLGQRVQGKMKVVRLRRSNPTDSTGLNVRKDLTVNSHNDVPGVEANGRAPPGWVITHVNKTPVESIADLKAVLDMGTLNVEVVLTEPAAAEAPQRHDRLLR